MTSKLRNNYRFLKHKLSAFQKYIVRKKSKKSLFKSIFKYVLLSVCLCVRVSVCQCVSVCVHLMHLTAPQLPSLTIPNPQSSILNPQSSFSGFLGYTLPFLPHYFYFISITTRLFHHTAPHALSQPWCYPTSNAGCAVSLTVMLVLSSQSWFNDRNRRLLMRCTSCTSCTSFSGFLESSILSFLVFFNPQSSILNPQF